MRALIFAAVLTACSGGGDDDVAPDAGTPDDGILVAGDLDGDEWPEDVDNCPGLANPEQRDRDGDGIGDDCDSCPSTKNNGDGSPAQDQCDPIDESEPNDAPGAGEAVTLVEVGRVREVRGTIEAPGADQSFDRFQIMVPAQTRMLVRVARARPESLLEPILVVSGGGYTVPRGADGLFAAEREIYVGEAGVYEFAIADRRGVLEGDPHGADTYAYALSIREIDGSPESVAAPFTARTFELTPPGTVGIFRADLNASSSVRIAAESAALDPVLIVERADGTVIENDNLAPGFLDARITLDLPAAETVKVVVDHARLVRTEDLEVKLTIDYPPDNLELEPNDVVGLASELVYPGETIGHINAPPDELAGPPDVDWYRFEGTAGTIVALTGLIPANSQVDPAFLLAKLEGEEIEELYVNLDSGGLAPRIEAVIHESGPYALGVADQRNFDGPPFVGSDDDVIMRYGIFAEPVGLQPEAAILTESGTVTAALATGGRLVRHLVIASGPTVVVARTLSVSAPEVEPFSRIYGPNATRLLGEGTPDAIAYLDSAETYLLAVHNANDGRGDVGWSYEIFVEYLAAAPAIDESEPNDQRTSADPMNASLPAVARATLEEAGHDFFSIALEAGSNVSIAISEGRRGKNLALYDDAGVFVNGGAGALDFSVATSGDYAIEVSGSAGPYTLIVR
jgi:hypothetical protein